MLRFLCYDRYQVSEKKKPIRRKVDWNTGERVHKPKKGKGSYERKKSLTSNVKCAILFFLL